VNGINCKELNKTNKKSEDHQSTRRVAINPAQLYSIGKMVNTSNKSKYTPSEGSIEADGKMRSPSGITEKEASSSIEQNSVT
jgi:hypothetical protein